MAEEVSGRVEGDFLDFVVLELIDLRSGFLFEGGQRNVFISRELVILCVSE